MELIGDSQICISDAGNNRIQVLNIADGSVVMTAGEYGTTGNKVQSVAGIGVHPLTNDIIVCDTKGHKMVRFNKKGEVVQLIKDRVRSPIDAAMDKSGNIFVVMAKKSAVFKYNSTGKYVGTIGGSGKAALIFPISIRLKDDEIFVADSSGRRVVHLSKTGECLTEFTDKGELEPMKGPTSAFAAIAEGIYVLDGGEIPVVLLDHKGKLISKVGAFGDSPGSFMYPKSIVANEKGEVLILDNNRNLIIKYQRIP
jgi:hypothetical protein